MLRVCVILEKLVALTPPLHPLQPGFSDAADTDRMCSAAIHCLLPCCCPASPVELPTATRATETTDRLPKYRFVLNDGSVYEYTLENPTTDYIGDGQLEEEVAM